MIKRDGAYTSLWQDSVQPYSPVSAPDRSANYDVIIAGGGITGISTALLLQNEGKTVSCWKQIIFVLAPPAVQRHT